MTPTEYYEVLGLEPSASSSQVKKAYKRLARKYHPDINPGDQIAEERFRQIQEAYRVLINLESWHRPSAGRRTPRSEPSRPTGFGPSDAHKGVDRTEEPAEGPNGFAEFLSDLFRGRRNRRRALQNLDLEQELEVSFLEAVRGFQARVNVTRLVACHACDQDSEKGEGRYRVCPTCRGQRQVVKTYGLIRFTTQCPLCKGKGRVRSQDCSHCGGNGALRTVETLTIRIPPGVRSGSRVRVPGKGNFEKSLSRPGDLYLNLRVGGHDFFKRDGNDIYCCVPVTVPEAALGAEIEIPTIDGPANLKVPPGTQNGQKLRLRGRGVPAGHGAERGDQLVEIQIVLPSAEDERCRELLRELDRLDPQDPRAHFREP